MKMKIELFRITRLKIDEVFGFHKQVEPLLELLPDNEKLQTFVTDYRKALEEFDDALKMNSTTKLTKAVEAADKRTDIAWSGINTFVNGLKLYPDEEVRKIADEAREIMEKYGNLPKLSYNEQYAGIYNLLQDFAEFGVAKQEHIFIAKWVEELQDGYNAYMIATRERIEVESKKVIGITKAKRTSADNAYRKICEHTNALIEVYGEEEYKEFVLQLNVLVKKQK